MRGYFDLCVVDEVHELKARGSAQGLAGAALAEACPKTLVLTGTLLGGCARRHAMT
jgi:superfamily II DNA or RNA helicase